MSLSLTVGAVFRGSIIRLLYTMLCAPSYVLILLSLDDMVTTTHCIQSAASSSQCLSCTHVHHFHLLFEDLLFVDQMINPVALMLIPTCIACMLLPITFDHRGDYRLQIWYARQVMVFQHSFVVRAMTSYDFSTWQLIHRHS